MESVFEPFNALLLTSAKAKERYYNPASHMMRLAGLLLRYLKLRPKGGNKEILYDKVSCVLNDGNLGCDKLDHSPRLFSGIGLGWR